MDEDDSFCPDCGTHFANAQTLAKHVAAIHRKADPPAAAPAASSVAKRPRPSDDQAPSENVELAPLLGVLTDEQKDALILRAVQADPGFYDRILEQAQAPLTEEAADARLSVLDGEGTLAAVRWFVTIGVPANALTLLVAASQRCLSALEELADHYPAAAATSASAAGEEEGEEEEASGRREELLGAVEALPAVGAVGALWVEVLAKPAAAVLVRSSASEAVDAMKLMLEGLQAAAASVRPIAPAVLVGAQVGETVDSLTEALKKLRAVLDAADAAAARGGKARRKES
jgi:hypothetical protein